MNKPLNTEPVSAQPKRTSKAADDWLYRFEVTVSSSQPHLYANGNQQVQLTVTVEPLDSQVVTPEQLKSISLYSKNSDGTYQPLPLETVSQGEWAQQAQRNQLYDYFDNAAAGSEPPQPAPLSEDRIGRAATYRELYVVSRAPGGSKIALIAGIAYDKSTTYYSDQNPFSSKQEVTAHPSRFFDDPDQFSFSRVGNPSNDRWTMTYRLRPVAANTVGFATATLTPDGMIKWARNESGNTFATIVGWVQINEMTVRYEQDITSKFPDDIQDLLKGDAVSNASPSDLIIFMRGDNRFPYLCDSAVNYPGPLQVRGYDKQGNPIQLAIAFDGESRENLAVQMMGK